MHPKVSERYGLKGKVFGFEFYPEIISKLLTIKKAPIFSTFPVVKEDLAFIFDKKIIAKDVVKAMKKVNEDLIESVTLFDVYEGSNLPEAKKSMAFSVRLRAKEKTLKTEEVQLLRAHLISTVEKEFQAQLR